MPPVHDHSAARSRRIEPVPYFRGECTCSAVKTQHVNGVEIGLVGPEETLRWVETALACPATHILNHLAAHPTVVARQEPTFAELLNRADLNVADGMGVVWACRAHGHSHMRERVYGPEFMAATISWGVAHGITHSFVGGTPETMPALIRNLKTRFPGAEIAEAYSPPFREVTRDGVDEDIGQLLAPADILWVGLGVPKQNIWADLARRRSPARIIVTVGAAFDFHAGKTRQAPKWMQNAGLEWAFRLGTEPRRLFRRYVEGNTRFVAGVGQDVVNQRRNTGK